MGFGRAKRAGKEKGADRQAKNNRIRAHTRACEARGCRWRWFKAFHGVLATSFGNGSQVFASVVAVAGVVGCRQVIHYHLFCFAAGEQTVLQRFVWGAPGGSVGDALRDTPSHFSFNLCLDLHPGKFFYFTGTKSINREVF